MKEFDGEALAKAIGRVLKPKFADIERRLAELEEKARENEKSKTPRRPGVVYADH